MGQLWSSPENQEENERESSPTRGGTYSPCFTAHVESVQPKRLRNARVTILNEILEQKAKLNDDLAAENVAILEEFTDTFIKQMKKYDKIFASLYQRIYYMGSYYTGLRVATPDEFDLSLVLKMPKPYEVTFNSQVPSYAKFKITDENKVAHEGGLSKFFEDGFLIPEKVKNWMQGVIDKALRTYKLPNRIIQIKCGASGPARTLTLVKDDYHEIDIDLVPAIEYFTPLDFKPPGIFGPVFLKVNGDLQCILVPKRYLPNKQPPVNELEKSRVWRAHYPYAERLILYNKQCVNNVIKLLKLLRDKENWEILASYYLKTVVMWMILDHPNDDYWRMDNMGERFVEALKKLCDCVRDREIRYFFSSKYNLIEKLTVAQAYNLQNRLQAIIRDIERDHNKLWKILGCEPTFTI